MTERAASKVFPGRWVLSDRKARLGRPEYKARLGPRGRKV